MEPMSVAYPWVPGTPLGRRRRAVLRVTELDGTIGRVVWFGQWEEGQFPGRLVSGPVAIGGGLVALVEIRREGNG